MASRRGDSDRSCGMIDGDRTASHDLDLSPIAAIRQPGHRYNSIARRWHEMVNTVNAPHRRDRPKAPRVYTMRSPAPWREFRCARWDCLVRDGIAERGRSRGFEPARRAPDHWLRP